MSANAGLGGNIGAVVAGGTPGVSAAGAASSAAGGNSTAATGGVSAGGASSSAAGGSAGAASNLAGATGGDGSAGSLGAGGSGGQGSTDVPIGGRGPTPPSATAKFPFPQNRENPNCVYPLGYSNDDVVALYQQWKADLVTSEGAGGFRRVSRVAEPGLEPRSTVSEGIAYGMLISVYMDDQALFDDLWQYAMKYAWSSTPSFGGSAESTLLMNWYILENGNVEGSGAATDADEDIAFALVMADRQWGGGGSLSRSYLDYAKELIDDIWKFEIADGRLPKNGSGWGDDNNLNISYFAPAYYRVFAQVSGNQAWGSDVVNYVYDVISRNLKSASGNDGNGLVPAWSTSNGDPAVTGPGQASQPFHYQYDSCRTPFRIGQDACWNGESRAKEYVAKTSSFFAPKGPQGIVDGYELNGTNKPEFPTNFGGLSGAFLGPAAVGAMHDAAFQGFLNDSYALLKQNTAWAGGQYYDESWIMMATLFMTGNFVDFTQY